MTKLSQRLTEMTFAVHIRDQKNLISPTPIILVSPSVAVTLWVAFRLITYCRRTAALLERNGS
jgi:hypothetical protein